MECYLIPKDEILLVNFLEGKPLSGFFVLDQVDGAVSSIGYQFDDVKVVLRGVLHPQSLVDCPRGRSWLTSGCRSRRCTTSSLFTFLPCHVQTHRFGRGCVGGLITVGSVHRRHDNRNRRTARAGGHVQIGQVLLEVSKRIPKQNPLALLKTTTINVRDTIIPVETQFSDDVLGHLCSDTMHASSLALRGFQQLVELLRVKL